MLKRITIAGYIKQEMGNLIELARYLLSHFLFLIFVSYFNCIPVTRIVLTQDPGREDFLQRSCHPGQ